jgi:NTP pyrophosphatase (non-canonical NTP hydrolase)
MDINKLAKKVEEVSKSYSEKFGINRDNDWFIFKIQEELGELTQKYLMLTKRGRQKGFSEEEIRKQFELEIADVICCTLLFANHNNVDIMKNIEEKWFKGHEDRLKKDSSKC